MRILPTDLPHPMSRARRRALIFGMAFSQMTAWGTTYYAPSVLGPAIGAEIGASPEVQFGGVTVMLLVSAALSPAAGRHIDRHGARAVAVLGSLLLAAGLFFMARSTGSLSYLASWVLIGVATPLSMGNAAFAAVAQGCPGEGRRPITLMMLMSGLSSGVYWPVAGWLQAWLGWRDTLLVFALLHLLVCLPIHAGFLRRSAGDMAAFAESAGEKSLPPEARRAAFWLIVAGAGLSGIVSWGLPLQFIPMFADAGVPAATAILIGALQSPAALAARLFDLALTNRLRASTLVSVAALVAPPVFLLLWFALRAPPVSPVETALVTVCVAIYGVCTGLITAARSTLPLELFGREGYATLLGKLSLWLNLNFAFSPLLFAALRQGGGLAMVMTASLALGIVAAYAFWRLDRLDGARSAA